MIVSRVTEHDESPWISIRPSTNILAAFVNLTTVHGAMISSSVTLTVYDSVNSTTPLHVVCALPAVGNVESSSIDVLLVGLR